MFEIEIKAHVLDYDRVMQTLQTIASYQGMTEKEDTYWHFATPNKTNNQGHPYISVRIRKEQTDTTSTIYFTYKRKELRQKPDGTTFEVNDEQETTLFDAKPLELMLADTGYVPALKKHKTVRGWILDTPQGQAHIELCTVHPLGDFIEIEILSSSNEPEHVEAVHAQLKEILTRCSIPLSQIEPRFYSDLLKQAQQENR